MPPPQPVPPGQTGNGDLAHAILGPAEVEIFENLYAAYAERARRTAFGVLHDEELAADAAHAAYIELLRYIVSGRRWNDPAEAHAAVVRNANWAALKMLRSRRRRPELALPAEAGAVDDRTWARTEARVLCEQVVDGLPEKQRTLLHLRFVDGLSSTECAARLGISAGVFEKRLARAVGAARGAGRGADLGCAGAARSVATTRAPHAAARPRRCRNRGRDGGGGRGWTGGVQRSPAGARLHGVDAARRRRDARAMGHAGRLVDLRCRASAWWCCAHAR